MGMSGFQGGSARNMAKSISDGFIRVAPPILKGLTTPQLKELLMELDILARDVRGRVVQADDQAGTQDKARTLMSLQSAMNTINNFYNQRLRNRI